MMPKTKTTALFTIRTSALDYIYMTASSVAPFEQASGKRVEIVNPGYLYNPDDDEYEATDEYQVIFPGESTLPWTVDRNELSEIQTEYVEE